MFVKTAQFKAQKAQIKGEKKENGQSFIHFARSF